MPFAPISVTILWQELLRLRCYATKASQRGKKLASSWNDWAKWRFGRKTRGWRRMPAGNDHEQRIRRLRDLAAEVRILAADMRHHESRSSLLQIATAYDELATILDRLSSAPSWLNFNPPPPLAQASRTPKD